LGQSVNDTYEEKGLAYITGNLTGDIAGMYFLGKARNQEILVNIKLEQMVFLREVS